MRSVWNLIGEKIDMTDKEAKAKWLNKRRRVLGGVMGGLSSYLDELEEGRSDWRQEEMREMSDMWVKRWKTYAKLPAEELKNIGWIEDVTKGKAA